AGHTVVDPCDGGQRYRAGIAKGHGTGCPDEQHIKRQRCQQQPTHAGSTFNIRQYGHRPPTSVGGSGSHVSTLKPASVMVTLALFETSSLRRIFKAECTRIVVIGEDFGVAAPADHRA